jgi:lysyl-tRNA synthetase class 1
MSSEMRAGIDRALSPHGIQISDYLDDTNDRATLPIQLMRNGVSVNIAALLSQATYFDQYRKQRSINHLAHSGIRVYSEELNALDITQRAQELGNYIQENEQAIICVLSQYESYEVARDEIERTLDLLFNLNENEEYFKRRIGSVAAFLPRNQPLYATTCFGVVPSYMASIAHVRAPQAMRHFFRTMCDVAGISTLCNNLQISEEPREIFVNRMARMIRDKNTGCKFPATDTVIFTGTMENADQLRRRFDPRVLFIANGAGHNPIVISPTADIDAAVKSVMRVQLYNQGQDCANPNALLVHSSIINHFVSALLDALQDVTIGPYNDPSNQIGPITEGAEMQRIHRFLLEHAQWIHPATPGIIRARDNILEPTIIVKPLKNGGNFTEQFAPIFFVQEYGDDQELSRYFDDPAYERNAMYVTLFGQSNFVKSLECKHASTGLPMHDRSTILYNTDLHAPGIERGTQPYGGYGRGASCYSINGVITTCPTLPQRDMYTQLVQPALQYETTPAAARLSVASS